MADGNYIDGKVRLASPLLEDYCYLTKNMRPDEIEQWEAVTGSKYDSNSCALGLASIPGLKFTIIDKKGYPVCVGGFEEIRPKVFQCWMAGTMDGWAKHWRVMTKFTRRIMDDMFESGQAQRIQIYALSSRTEAHRWYEKGLQCAYEGEHPYFFAGGQSAVCYAKTIAMHKEASHGRV